MGDDDVSKDGTLPSAIANGKEFKEAALKNGFELDWVMKKFQQIGISKSADYVNSEQGSYLDLLNKLMDMSKNEKSEESEEL
jgi:murein tripeptide amidase MpaA